MSKVTKSFQYGEHTVTIETGEIARQASTAVMVSMGETVVMVSAVGRKEANPGQSFFPLTVNYQENSTRRVVCPVVSSSVRHVRPKKKH